MAHHQAVLGGHYRREAEWLSSGFTDRWAEASFDNLQEVKAITERRPLLVVTDVFGRGQHLDAASWLLLCYLPPRRQGGGGSGRPRFMRWQVHRELSPPPHPHL
ncbi:hypothetical protein Pcinc_022457 [Petrolisthes cinctipes]|uniref:Uncharacterized protein n=1 Tax=Petrolisthes cinctipes TaxID=88211 RepID=A0AAE1FHQ7_PETCI|nr:hypothetical protein Pcinc_042066 [Petrolisthes cinctipes]KAK3872463.1 hypothetical protein Pcinc_022457 [Petrolisthes cinctipes]